MTDRELLEKILSKVDTLEAGQKALEEENRYTRILIENEVFPKIKLIAEQHGDIIKKLDTLADYPETKSRVSTLESVVKSQSHDIQDLKRKVI